MDVRNNTDGRLVTCVQIRIRLGQPFARHELTNSQPSNEANRKHPLRVFFFNLARPEIFELPIARFIAGRSGAFSSLLTVPYERHLSHTNLNPAQKHAASITSRIRLSDRFPEHIAICYRAITARGRPFKTTRGDNISPDRSNSRRWNCCERN